MHLAGTSHPSLARRGIYIIEYLETDELAAARAYRFTFVCAPLKLVGTAGSPVRPPAVMWPSEI